MSASLRAAPTKPTLLRLARTSLAALACVAGLGAAAGCTDGTTPDCTDAAQCLPVLVEASPTDAPENATGDAADDATDAGPDATPTPDGG